MERIIVHTIFISKPKEKRIFQIALPENTEAITGIGVTTDKTRIYVGGAWQKIERSAGTLQLFAADSGEHLFSDDLKAIYTPCKMQVFDQVFPIRTLPSYKTKFGLMDTWQPVHTTIIDAYYKDLIGYVSETTNYTIRIYVRVKLSMPCTWPLH